jgi:hypothetical protein
MKHTDIPQDDVLTGQALAQWAQAFGYVADHYRVACSPGALMASAPGYAANQWCQHSLSWRGKQGCRSSPGNHTR